MRMFSSGMFNLPPGWLLPFIEATHIISRKEFAGARKRWSYELAWLTVQFAWLQPKVLRWLACTHSDRPGSSGLDYIWTLVVHRTGRDKHNRGATRSGAITGT